MLMPEAEPPKHLQRAEVDAALVSLVQDSGAMARARKLARVIAHGLPAMDADDLLAKAMMLMLAEKAEMAARALDLGNAQRGDAQRRLSRPQEAGLPAWPKTLAPRRKMIRIESSPLAEGVSPETDPARSVARRIRTGCVQQCREGDEELELLVEALAEGMTGMGIAQELGWDAKRYDAARKRLSRRLAALKDRPELVMTNPNGDKPGNEKFLDALVEELRTMSDTDALEGENAEELVKLGERLLKSAREEAGKLRMAEAKRKLSVVSKYIDLRLLLLPWRRPERYLESRPNLTLAARGLNELSDADVLDLFDQAKSLEEADDSDAEDNEG